MSTPSGPYNSSALTDLEVPRDDGTNLAMPERVLSLAAGALLLFLALRKRERSALLAALPAAYLVKRGLTGYCEVTHALGLDKPKPAGSSCGVVEKSVTINRPIGQVFATFRNFAALPQLMKHLNAAEPRSWYAASRVFMKQSRKTTMAARPEAQAAGARLDIRHAKFETIALPRCTLVNSSFALPLCPPEAFPGLWSRICDALESGGRIACQLLGPRDSWAARRPPIAIHSRAEAETLLAGLETEMLEEEETDSITPRGQKKHWHIFHIVARKR